MIELNVPERTLNVLISDEEMHARLQEWKSPVPSNVRGYHWLYLNHVLRAHEGCDFDFARANGQMVDDLSGGRGVPPTETESRGAE